MTDEEREELRIHAALDGWPDNDAPRFGTNQVRALLAEGDELRAEVGRLREKAEPGERAGAQMVEWAGSAVGSARARAEQAEARAEQAEDLRATAWERVKEEQARADAMRAAVVRAIERHDAAPLRSGRVALVRDLRRALDGIEGGG